MNAKITFSVVQYYWAGDLVDVEIFAFPELAREAAARWEREASCNDSTITHGVRLRGQMPQIISNN